MLRTALLVTTLLAAAPAARADPDWAPPAFADPVGPATTAAVPPLAPAALPEAAARAGLRERVVAAARHLLGRPFRGDCSGFVLSLLRGAGIRASLPPARSRSEALWRGGAPVEAPQAGDLAFFHDTYDRNHDGRLNDRFTHVALVEKVEGELVWLVHRGLRGVERIRMDLARPDDASVNDRVRLPRKGEPPGTPHLAGELFAGFGAVAP